MSSKIVTRFAPSPTGYLHVGGARTALFNWLLARSTGGEFLLRVEDTDLARSSEESVRSLLEDLRWLGLDWDNRTLIFQSKRQAVYNALIDELIGKELAYHAYETPAELAAQRQIAERQKRPYLYRRPRLTEAQIRQYQSEGRPSVVRFAMPAKEYRFDDVVLGKEIVLGESQVQDFVIRKTDGMPTYHFAVVADDAAMGITHILRGQEHLLNTINHIALQNALGYPRPIYGHLPVILNPDGAKMGKRDRDRIVKHHANLWLKSRGKTVADLASESNLPLERVQGWLDSDARQLDASEQKQVMSAIGLAESALPEILIHDFRANGYLPDVLLNFLSLLGWSPGGDRERMSVKEMVRLFTLDRIGQANAKFNREKLLAFNTEACVVERPTQLVLPMRDFLALHPDSPLNRADDATLEKIIQMNAGMRTLREIDEKSRFLLTPDAQLKYLPEVIEKVLLKNDKQGLSALTAARPALEAVYDWTASAIEMAIKRHCEAVGLGLGKVAQPIRVAVSGTAVSPPIFESLALLGKASTLMRIDHCVQVAMEHAGRMPTASNVLS